jgi:hypothetical protein
LPFCEEILEEIAGHEMYTFGDGYRGYHQVKIAPEDQLKTTFTTPWGTFCYTIMPFGLCNASGTFQHLMNKVFDPFLGLFLRVFIDDFGVYNNRASHLAKLELVFQRLDASGVTLLLFTGGAYTSCSSAFWCSGLAFTTNLTCLCFLCVVGS